MSQEEKIQYEKPEALDLGSVAPVVGASCATGTYIQSFRCQPTGNQAGGICSTGNSASAGCFTGSSAA